MSFIYIGLFGLAGGVFFYNLRLQQRARALSARVERALKNQPNRPVDFFKTQEAQKTLGARYWVERVANQLSLLQQDKENLTVTFSWKPRNLAEQLDELEKEFHEYTRKKMKQKWKQPSP